MCIFQASHGNNNANPESTSDTVTSEVRETENHPNLLHIQDSPDSVLTESHSDPAGNSSNAHKIDSHEETEDQSTSQETCHSSENSNGNKDSDAITANNDSRSTARKRADAKFQKSWTKVWDWLYYENGKMYCRTCIATGKDNAFTQGCVCLRTSSMSRHEETADHKCSIKAKSLRPQMEAAMSSLNSEQDNAVMKAMKVVYWLADENLPLSKYESLIGLLKELGVPGLEPLKVSERVEYDSYFTANEMLLAINQAIDEDLNQKIERSPVVTLFADESTDVSNTKRMTISCRVINPETAESETIFLRDTSYEDGTGQGLTEEILKEAKIRQIKMHKVMGIGTDGAKVMTGEDKGVYGRLKELNPHMLNIHCMAHRLALCTSQAANTIPAMKRYQEWLTSLFYYFRASPTRASELQHIQEVLEHPTLKYKEIHAVRWLSFYEALAAVYRTIDPLITYLHQRSAKKDPKAKGLLKKLASEEHIYITYLLMDVMPIVSKLCLTFQKEDLDVTKAKVYTQGWKLTLARQLLAKHF